MFNVVNKTGCLPPAHQQPRSKYVVINKQTHMLVDDDDKMRLISEFEQRPWLWNHQKDGSFNRNQVLTEIAESMSSPDKKITVKMVNDTWRALRDYFNKLYNKADAEQAIKWKFYQPISFLASEREQNSMNNTSIHILPPPTPQSRQRRYQRVVKVEVVNNGQALGEVNAGGTEFLDGQKGFENFDGDYMETSSTSEKINDDDNHYSISPHSSLRRHLVALECDDASFQQQIEEPIVLQVSRTYRELSATDRQLANRFKRQISNICFDYEDELALMINNVSGEQEQGAGNYKDRDEEISKLLQKGVKRLASSGKGGGVRNDHNFEEEDYNEVGMLQ